MPIDHSKEEFVALPKKPSNLSVTLSDGRMIKGANGIETFLLFVEEMGWERVRDLNFMVGGINLVSDEKIKQTQREIVPGWFVNCSLKGLSRMMLIYKIAKALGEKIHCSFN